MGLHSDTPIYKATFELLKAVVLVAKNMPRDFKQTLACDLRDHCVKVTVLILRANKAQDKTPHLEEILERHQEIELLIRLARDIQVISLAQYAKIIQLSDNVGKQANGWRGSQLRQTHEGQGHHDRTLF